MRRNYYSVRTGKHPTGGKIDLPALQKLTLAVYQQFEHKDYFQEAFGFECVDAGYIEGAVGHDIEAFIFHQLRKDDLWPIPGNIKRFSEDDIFDVIELLYDKISLPVSGEYHAWNDCGFHYDTFDKPAGQSKFREEINEILNEYAEGYQLQNNGEITTLPPQGLQDLETAPFPPGDEGAIQRRVQVAIDKFRRRGITPEERRDAVRDLADVLEYLRPKAKTVLNSKDENDLFNLVNNFGIRHHNKKQKTDYDTSIWLSWMYYYFLGTIHAVTRLIQKRDG